MKTLLVSLVLFVFLSHLSARQQGGINGDGTNNWFLFPSSVCVVDSSATGTYSDSSFQRFRSAGNTITFNGMNYSQFQTTWFKDFWESYPVIPDTFVLRVKFIGGSVDIVNAVVGIAIQDSSSYSWPSDQEINMSGEWQEIKFDMSHQKTFMSNFGRLYLIWSVATSDSCYVWYENGVDYIKGIDDTLGVIIYDNFDGPSSISVIEEFPSDFVLEQNYPNPFNPSTTIRFTVPEREQVSLVIFNSLGQEIQTLVSEERGIGTYEVSFDASELPSGVYFYRLTADKYIETKKMMFLK